MDEHTPGSFDARLALLLELPAPAPRDGTYADLRSGLVREEREALDRALELQQLLTSVTQDSRARRAVGGVAAQSELAGYARGYRAGLRAARRIAEQAQSQAGRVLEGLQDEVLRLNDEAARLRSELEQVRAARERKVRSVRKDEVHVPENAEEARRVARNIEEFLKIAEGGEMDLEEIRARLPEEANVRDALHHLLLARRATIHGSNLRLVQPD
ncbi:hypothetical protein [Deinococcus peraridilitoris]|uniref:hypothetical protein n=1 Tax=Deinococcus peraridilitoris TaxID=432329 RepID=UPI0012FB6FE6|nr:hypothetical protein [Deinococcus peraridilitoris]